MDEIVSGLMDSLKDHLQDKMIDDVPDEYRTVLTYQDKNDIDQILVPSLIQVGRFQNDPTTLATASELPSIYLAIHAGDPDDMGNGWKHSVASSVEDSMTNLGLRIGYPRELGGSTKWQRCFKVSGTSFYIYSDQNQENASQLTQFYRALLEKYCESYRPGNLNGWQCGGLQDSFGESVLQADVAKSQCIERGGPTSDYIWDIEVWVQVLTERA